MKKIRDPGSPRVEGFWPWESLLSRILSGSRLEPWLEPLTFPAGAPWIFLIFFIFFIFLIFFVFWPFRKKSKKSKKIIDVFDFFRFLAFAKKIKKKSIIFFDFFRKGQKTKKIKKMKKNPGPWVSPRGGFLAVGIPPLPDPEWLQAGALAGALDSPCGGTLDFFDFFHFFDFFIFFEKPKNQKNQ